MQTNLSTSSSDVQKGEPAKLIRRLGFFLAPYLVLGVLAAAVGATTGELLPARTAAWMQSFGRPVLYLPKLTDHSFAYKLAGTQFNRPEILALGGSRANQWRSAMFGADFYNAAQSVYTFKDYSEFISALDAPYPRVIIFSVDIYNFIPEWNAIFVNRQKADLNPLDIRQLPIQSLAKEIAADPMSSLDLTEPLYGVPSFGLLAQRQARGFRNDGSFQYGAEILGDFRNSVTVPAALERVRSGVPPFNFAADLGVDGFADLSHFVRLARDLGIQLIGVTMPYDPEVSAALEISPNHGIWSSFRTRVPEWMEEQGIRYYDFTDLDSFGSRRTEFIDPFHPSETAFARALIKMADEPDVRSLLHLDRSALVDALHGATNLEVYRNEFRKQP